MQKETRPDASIFVIFGGAGDLTWRKLVPALYNLFLDHWLPEKFWVLGLDRAKMSNERFVKHLHEGVDSFSRRGRTDKEQWKAFSEHFAYMQADFSQAKTFAAIADKLAQKEDQWGLKANRIFYMAVPPRMIETLSQGLADVKLNRDRRYTRIVVEKPFGHDLDSARALNRSLGKLFDESQIFRIDHYLGKETVQNILAFRFANSIFEPIWNRHYIDHVQITVAENLGVGHRGDYYDHAGALRDMIQNHLLQVLCLIAMEAPDFLRRQRGAQQKSGRPARHPQDTGRPGSRVRRPRPVRRRRHREVKRSRLTSAKPTWPKTRARRHSPPSNSLSTTGAGRMSPFTCAPANACRPRSPKCPFNFARFRTKRSRPRCCSIGFPTGW